MQSDQTPNREHDHSDERHHRHMVSMLLVCVAVGLVGFYVGGLDYLWVALMGSCLVMHFMHTRRKKEQR